MKVALLIRRLQHVLETEGDIEVDLPNGEPIKFVQIMNAHRPVTGMDLTTYPVEKKVSCDLQLRKKEKLARHKARMKAQAQRRADYLIETEKRPYV